MLPEAKRSVLRKDAIDVIQLSSGMQSSELLSGLQWAFATVHKGFFFDTLHNDNELLVKLTHPLSIAIFKIFITQHKIAIWQTVRLNSYEVVFHVSN